MNEPASAPPVKFADLLDGYEMAGFDSLQAFRAFIDLDTGKVHIVSDVHELGDEEEMELEETGNILPLPSKHDLDLGKRLVFAFADRFMSDADADRIYSFFSRRGGYRRFKDLLEIRSMQQAWYDFEEAATKKALRAWCEENGITLTDD
jgi:hypothetical protein